MGLSVHQLPILAGICPCSSSYLVPRARAAGSVPISSKVDNKWKSGGRAPRRLILGLGVSFWAQLMNMSGAVGGKSFTASARLKSGPSFEEVGFLSKVRIFIWSFSCFVDLVSGFSSTLEFDYGICICFAELNLKF